MKIVPTIIPTLTLAVFVIAGGSLRRKGRLPVSTYNVLLLILTAICLASAALYYRSVPR